MRDTSEHAFLVEETLESSFLPLTMGLHLGTDVSAPHSDSHLTQRLQRVGTRMGSMSSGTVLSKDFLPPEKISQKPDLGPSGCPRLAPKFPKSRPRNWGQILGPKMRPPYYILFRRAQKWVQILGPKMGPRSYQKRYHEANT